MASAPPVLFDRAAIRLRRERAARLRGDAFLLAAAAEQLSERLQAVNRRFERGLSVGVAAPAIARHAAQWTTCLMATDEIVAADAGGYDLAVSLLELHTVNDLPGVLLQIRRALKPDGLFMAALFGGDTLSELKASLAAAELATQGGVSPRVSPFADVRELGGLLQRAGFALPVADLERTTVLYRDVHALVRDLRAHGQTNVLAQRRRQPLSRATLAEAAAHYQSCFAAAGGKLRATFDIVYLTGWAPHESQQKPLPPGSARSRLADALGVREQSAGDAARNR